MDRAEVIKALEEWSAELDKISGSHTWQYRKKVLAETIAALREQEKREQGCGYCDMAKAYGDIVNPSLWKKGVETNRWTMMGKPLKFCPMCGRKLTEPPKGE